MSACGSGSTNDVLFPPSMGGAPFQSAHGQEQQMDAVAQKRGADNHAQQTLESSR